MNRNTESHFSTVPILNIRRSKFTRPHDHKTTWNTGEIIPIYYDGTIMPGDGIKMKMSEVVRSMTPITPVMDVSYMDTYFFFVPYRLVWEHFKQFFGENDTAPWTQQVEYQIPQIVAPEAGWKKGSLADHFGYPTEVGGYKASALPFRVYCAVINRWFRDQNLKNPCYISMGDSDITGTDKSTLGSDYDYVVDTEKGAAPYIAAKGHDFFTSALPEPQKGPSIGVPLGETAPVIAKKPHMKITADSTDLPSAMIDEVPIFQTQTSGYGILIATGTQGAADQLRLTQSMELAADLSSAVGATINQLRQAYAIQKYYENAARGGTRYIETVKAHWNVTSSDARMQDPEYIGGKRVMININQVVQHDATQEDLTPMGTTGAYSVTTDTNDDLFSFAAQEHGAIIGLAVIRTEHTYQQGLNAQFSMKKIFDFYVPELANLGELPIKNKEIYLDGTDEDEEVFGYQEAWAHYRYMPNIVTGELRSNYAQSLDIWHYADYYEERPTLSGEWIDETTENVARTLAVQSHDQFFGDFYFEPIYTRPMPLYSVPGLTGHY